jgi:hypothetical protein
MEPIRYRISDQGILLYFCDQAGTWKPIECSYYQHYCSIECQDFATDGKTAVLKCCDIVPETQLELEE